MRMFLLMIRLLATMLMLTRNIDEDVSKGLEDDGDENVVNHVVKAFKN